MCAVKLERFLVSVMRVCLLLLAIVLNACGPRPTGDGGEIFYIGAAPTEDGFAVPDETDAVSRRVRVGGLWYERDATGATVGVGLGWRDLRTAVIPLDCRVVFLIEDQAALSSALTLTRDLLEEGQPLCLVED